MIGQNPQPASADGPFQPYRLDQRLGIGPGGAFPHRSRPYRYLGLDRPWDIEMSMLWHSRSTTEPAHVWLRGLVAAAVPQ